MLETTYDAYAIEQDISQFWQDQNAFQPQGGRYPFCIMMPPPNITGSLHIGHALNQTLQDILVRFHRMRGANTLWQPGTDHAGIATQMVVETRLEKEGQARRDLGRDGFVARVWQWRRQSGDIISSQLRRLGVSADWSRERFTMDEGLSQAVVKTFVRLYRDGLIYKDKRLVNWDPQLLTAVSDLEVVPREIEGMLYFINYPLADDPSQAITIATTRPETVFGDVAIAVHPHDERYHHLVGREVILPLVGRRLPIIADEHANPEQGSGAVKITPAHDFNDFDVGLRHHLEMIVIFDHAARLNDKVPQAFQGLERFEARASVLAALDKEAALVRSSPHRHVVPHGDRSGVPIEPYLTDQWFLDAKALARSAIQAVETGKVRFVPQSWETTYFRWLQDIHPWCISRQLWWGHRIPAWYDQDGCIFVATSEEEAYCQARATQGHEVVLHQDEDVLDTWFSSALWPFSSLGWPEETVDLEQFYPSSVLVSGFDIIFFWVARMIMMGQYVMGEVPFRDVYIHALVRDSKGQKMSKSRGNVIDPIALIDTHGADALRFALASLAAQGRDIKLSEKQVEGARHFCVKLWNAARFLTVNQCHLELAFDPESVTSSLDRWAIVKMRELTAQVTMAIEGYHFDEAARLLYEFAWRYFCDWYIELVKPDLESGSESSRACAAWLFSHLLTLLHPLIPFVTEALWHKLGYTKISPALVLGIWPDGMKPDDGSHLSHGPRAAKSRADKRSVGDAESCETIETMISLIRRIRATRSALNIAPAVRINAAFSDGHGAIGFRPYQEAICRLARLNHLQFDDNSPKNWLVLEWGSMRLSLDVSALTALSKEERRLARRLSKMKIESQHIADRLADESFLARAPPEVVAETQERLQACKGEITSIKALTEALSHLDINQSRLDDPL